VIPYITPHSASQLGQAIVALTESSNRVISGGTLYRCLSRLQGHPCTPLPPRMESAGEVGNADMVLACGGELARPPPQRRGRMSASEPPPLPLPPCPTSAPVGKPQPHSSPCPSGFVDETTLPPPPPRAPRLSPRRRQVFLDMTKPWTKVKRLWRQIKMAAVSQVAGTLTPPLGLSLVE
jgi:hypothetical protein